MSEPRAGLACAAREPSVSARVVQALMQVVERAGGSGLQLLGAAGLETAQLEAADARLPRREVYRLCELALDLTGDPALGLHWAERLTVNAFVPVSYLFAHAASLREGFESLSRFKRLLSDETSYELLEQADQVTVRFPPPAGESLRIQRFSAEMHAASFFWIVRSLHVQARPVGVSFAYPAPAYRHEYTRVFDHAERFEQPFTGIVFDRALLDAALPNKDEGVHEALQALAERRMSRRTQGAPYALRVRELLVERGWPERIGMQSVAHSLGLSTRSLRRRLASEGKPYHEIENDAFAIVAKHLLRDKQRTIQETAYELGFSDTTTFHRAFKRATGTTPHKYLEEQLGNVRR